MAPDIRVTVRERGQRPLRAIGIVTRDRPKRRADAGAVTIYLRRVPSRPGVRPAVSGAGFTRAKEKGEGR